MHKHSPVLVVFAAGCLGLGLGGSPAPRAGDDITPIASTITAYQTTLDVEGVKYSVAIAYAHEGNTVFVLPVWYVREVSRPRGPALKPSDLVAAPDEPGTASLEIDVANLLDDEKIEEAIQKKLKARIAQRDGTPADKLKFQVPRIQDQSYRFTLIASGRGDETLPAEVPITNEVKRLPNGRLRLQVERAALQAIEKENGSPLTLAATHLRVFGLMRVRFEQTQIIAQVDFIRGAIGELRKRVSSLKDSSGSSPDVLVEMAGGSASSDNLIRSLAQQALSVTIAARSGADTAPIMQLVQAELNALIEQRKVTVTADNQRLGILLDKQVAITATVGEIHKLAKLDEKQREEAFKAASEDYNARRAGKSSNYNGSISFNGFGIGAGVAAGYGTSSNEDDEKRSKRESDTLKRGFDKLMKEFNGRIPTLTGIAFDDKSLSSSIEQVSQRFQSKKLESGDSLHRWPLVSLAGRLDSALTPEQLLRQYAILKADYDRLQNLLGTPQKIADAKANMERVETLAAELRRKAAALDRALAAFEKSSRDALAQVDQAAVAKLQKELRDLQKSNNLKKVGDTITNKLGMKFAWVPPGQSWLGGGGSKAGTEAFTLPSGLWCGVYPVTQAEWEAVMGDTPSHFKNNPRYPVESVSWDRVQEFLAKLNKKAAGDGLVYRLPTEQEWEYICRGGPISQQQSAFHYYFARSKTDLTSAPTNDLSNEQANFNSNLGHPSEVGSYLPNPLGIYDLHGNVWQWTSSAEGLSRVIRGGSWYSRASNCAAAYRYWYAPGDAYESLGFRLLAVPSK